MRKSEMATTRVPDGREMMKAGTERVFEIRSTKDKSKTDGDTE